MALPTNITLDAIIRRDLAMKKLPLHFYLPFLVLAKRGLEELHFDTLYQIKAVTLSVNAGDMVDMPSGLVDVIFLGVEKGDKVRKYGKNLALNDRLNQDTGVDIPFTEETGSLTYESNLYNLGSTILENFYDQNGNYRGRIFGRELDWVDSYKVLRDLGKIRIDNRSQNETIHLVYLAMPEKVSDQSVIHPYAQSALLAYINWKWSENNSPREVSYWRNEFYNEERKLRGRMNEMDITDILRSMRSQFRLSFKN